MENVPSLDALRIQAQSHAGSLFTTEQLHEKPLPFSAGEFVGVVLATIIVLGASKLRR